MRYAYIHWVTYQSVRMCMNWRMKEKTRGFGYVFANNTFIAYTDMCTHYFSSLGEWGGWRWLGMVVLSWGMAKTLLTHSFYILWQQRYGNRNLTIEWALYVLCVCACVSSVVRYTMVQLYRTNRNILLLYIWFHHSVGRCHFILPLLQAVLSMPLVIIRHVTTFRISMHKCSKKKHVKP